MMLNQREQELLAKNSSVESVELWLPDINGLVRGKQIPISELQKIYENGVCLPGSLFGTDITGNTVEGTGLGFAIGDKDHNCFPVDNTLYLQSWRENKIAQLLLSMYSETGRAFEVNPRQLLKRVLRKYTSKKLQPVVAVELEFYLFQLVDNSRSIHPPINPVTGKPSRDTQVYYLADLDVISPFIKAVTEHCQDLQVPVEAIVAEYAPGQFEINLKYRSDVIRACDDAIYLKQIVKAVAKKYGYGATFMAKPYSEQSGSGMHIHASIKDMENGNIFSGRNKKPSKLLKNAISGLQQSFYDFMLVFAPHANSYRRFQEENFVPMTPCWSLNNRTVALRIPLSDGDNLRIEHRVSGADANPYLVCAAVLAGMLYGLEHKLDATKAITGNAYRKVGDSIYWQKSLDVFNKSPIVKEYFGARFQKHFYCVKQEEQNKFNRHISPLEYEWYLNQV